MSAPVSEQNHNERHAVDDVTCVPLRSRRRRDRTQFTTNDVLRLEDYFFIDRYPDIHARDQLAEELAVSEDRIQVRTVTGFCVGGQDSGGNGSMWMCWRTESR